MHVYMFDPNSVSFYSYKSQQIEKDLFILGKVEMKHLSDMELVHFQMYNVGTILPVFFRLQKGGKTFYSLQYTKVRVRNSYTVLFRSVQGNELFGEILYFAVLKEATAVAVIRSFQMYNVSQFFPASSNIQQIQPTDIVHVIPVSNVLEKCVCVNVGNTYVCRFPCDVHFD